jgi:CHAT domain-containing protein
MSLVRPVLPIAATVLVCAGAGAALAPPAPLSLWLAGRLLRGMPATTADIDLRGPGQRFGAWNSNAVEIGEGSRRIRKLLGRAEGHLGRTAEFACVKGRVRVLEGLEDEAIALFHQAAYLYPKEACTAFGAGLAYASRAARENRAADSAHAVEEFLKAAEMGGGAAAYYDAAVALERIPAPNAALKVWRKVLSTEPAGPWNSRIREGIARCERIPEERRQRVDAALAGDPSPAPRGSLDLLQTQALIVWLKEPARYRAELATLAGRLREIRRDPWLADLVGGLPAGEAAVLLSEAAAANRDARYEAAARMAGASFKRFSGSGSAAGRIASAIELAQAESRVSGPAACLDAMRGIRREAADRSFRWLELRAWLQEINCKTRGRDMEVMRERMAAATASPDWGYEGLALRAQAVLADPFFSLNSPSQVWQNARGLLGEYWRGVYPQPVGVTYYASLALASDTAGESRLAEALIGEAISVLEDHPNRSLRADLWADLADAESRRERYREAAEYYDRSSAASPDPSRAGRLSALADVARASAELQAGRRTPAIELTRKSPAGEAFPYSGFGYYDRLRLLPILGGALLDIGRQDEALRHFETAVGECRNRLNGVRERGQRQALLRESEDSWRGLARAKLQAGDVSGALETWQEFRSGRDPEQRPLVYPAGTAWLSYAVLRDEVAIWAADWRGVERHSIRRAGLEERIERLAALLSDPRSPMDAISPLTRELEQVLIEPAAAKIAQAEALVIDADRWIASTPWAALEDSAGRRLIDRHALIQSHGWREAARGFGRGPTRLTPALAVADPALGRGAEKRFPPLVDARAEADALRGQLPQTRVLTGAEAQPGEVLRALPKVRLFHFAGHGTSEGGMGALLLAPESEGADSRLTAQHISALDLSSLDLVVLNACSSGAGESGGVLDLESLVRAFLEAGARAVVSAGWNIASRPAAVLMEEYYSRLRGGASAAEALRAAALSIRNRPPTAHPYYWAAFQVYGGF